MKKTTFYFPLAILLFTGLSATQTHAQPDSSHIYHAPDGTSIYYEVKGSGYPVVLVHGFINTANTWKKTPVYLELLKEGYQVIIMDLRGNGRSDKPHTAAAYQNDAQAKDIMGIVSELGIPKYDVVGYSRGSIIAARLLALDMRVNKAILGGMGAEFTNPEWPRRIQFYHALMGEDVPELKGMVQYVQQSGLDQLALAYQQKEQPSTSREILGKLTQEVLVICGDHDTDNGSATELTALIPKGQCAKIPGDHNHAASSKEFATEVLAFIKK
jgi:pimeloyl-ACP methyl ester carboxylesterase